MKQREYIEDEKAGQFCFPSPMEGKGGGLAIVDMIASTYSKRQTKHSQLPFIACVVSALPEWSASHPTDTLLCSSDVGAKRV